jgi:hypothetical protein
MVVLYERISDKPTKYGFANKYFKLSWFALLSIDTPIGINNIKSQKKIVAIQVIVKQKAIARSNSMSTNGIFLNPILIKKGNKRVIIMPKKSEKINWYLLKLIFVIIL